MFFLASKRKQSNNLYSIIRAINNHRMIVYTDLEEYEADKKLLEIKADLSKIENDLKHPNESNENTKDVIISHIPVQMYNGNWAIEVPLENKITHMNILSKQEAKNIAYQINLELTKKFNKKEIIYMCHSYVLNEGKEPIPLTSGSYKPIDSHKLISAETLREEMEKQKYELLIGEHPDGYLVGWSGFLVCKEGVYTWDETEEDYIYYGEINEHGEVVKVSKPFISSKNKVEFIEDYTFVFPSNNEYSNTDYVEFTVKKGQVFELLSEFVRIADGKEVKQYVVNIDTANYFGVVVPASYCKVIEKVKI